MKIYVTSVDNIDESFLLTKKTLPRAIALSVTHPNMSESLENALFRYTLAHRSPVALRVLRFIKKHGIALLFTMIVKYRKKVRVPEKVRIGPVDNRDGLEPVIVPSIKIHIDVTVDGLSPRTLSEVLNQLSAIDHAIGSMNINLISNAAPTKIPQFDKSPIRKDILDYVRRLSVFVEKDHHKDHETLWEAIIGLPEVDKDIYRKRGKGHTFNLVLVANIIRILWDKGVYYNTNATNMALILEGASGKSVRNYIGRMEYDEIRKPIYRLLEKMWKLS